MSDENPAGDSDDLPDDIAEVLRGEPDPDRPPSLHERFVRLDEERRRRGDLPGAPDADAPPPK